jgi:hypothetical protein
MIQIYEQRYMLHPSIQIVYNNEPQVYNCKDLSDSVQIGLSGTKKSIKYKEN